MIYLITGGMGTGKTSLAVEMILNNYEGLFKIESEDGTLIDRPLYFCHIDGLDEQKFKAHRITEQEIQSAPLNEILPEGSVLLIDECDYTYPLRSSARAVPPYIQTLKELRHDGFTLILMTQHPSMVDKYIRQLVNKHIHLERKAVGTKRYEWYHCEENLNVTTFASSIEQFYKPSAEAQKYFKSASKHVKFKKSYLGVLKLLPVGALVLVFLVFRIINGWQNKADTLKGAIAATETTISPKTEPSASSPVSALDFKGETRGTEGQASEVVGVAVADYVPRIPSLPETKPIYDRLRRPVNMETVAGCVKSKNSCNCYTEQATKVFVSKEMCAYWAENGIFQIYKNMDNTQQVAQSAPVSGQ